MPGNQQAAGPRRVAVERFAWACTGAEFGSRQRQYVKFYGGVSFLGKRNVYPQF